MAGVSAPATIGTDDAGDGERAAGGRPSKRRRMVDGLIILSSPWAND